MMADQPRPIRVPLSALCKLSLDISEAADSINEVLMQLRYAMRNMPTPYHQFMSGPVAELEALRKRLEALAGNATANSQREAQGSPTASARAQETSSIADQKEDTDA